MRELVLGQIPDNFNPEIHIPVSASCFIGKEDVYPNFEDLDFVWSVDNREELVYFDKYASNEALRLVNIVAKANNRDFNEFSFQYWKTIYYPYLGILIPWLLRKQIIIDKILKKYPNEKFIVTIVNDDFNTEFSDEFQYIIDGIWNPEINEWAFSNILKPLVPQNWIVKHKSLEVSSDKITLDRFKRKEKSIRSSFIELYREVFFRSQGVYGFSKRHSIFFHVLLSLKPALKVKEPAIYKQEIDRIKWQFDVELIINKLLPNSLKNVNNISTNILRKIRVGKIINFSNKLYYNIYEKLLAANSYEKGGVVIATQHGGHNYGSALTFEYGNQIEYNSDFFISFGPFKVNREVKDNFISLPSPLLSKYLDKYKRGNNKIILVGTIMNLFSNRFDSVVENYNFRYRNSKILFFDKLDDANIWYRPYNEVSTSLEDWSYVKRRIESVHKVEGDLHNELKKCKLVVLDHPGTTWNITMVMNTPTILYWDREHFPFNKEADKYIDKLEALGIFFDNPISAAEKVNLINEQYDDLSDWWNQKEIQILRKDWMNKYARADKNWVWIWMKELWKLK